MVRRASIYGSPCPQEIGICGCDCGTRREPRAIDYELDQIIDLQPQQNLAVDFRPEMGGFVLM